MRTITIIILVFLIATVGCTQKKSKYIHEEWKVSPLFKSNGYTMIGEENKLGFIYNDNEVDRFYPHKKQRYMWHLWAGEDEIKGVLKVKGRSQNGDKEILIFSSPVIQSPLNGADGHVISTMTLPSVGLWKLDAYIGENYFGSITVEVHENK